ncbi:class Ib ribonucleoside-diphosphate reductase assembly flavoprotein NrdI [Agrococcus jejuensis]|uniref:class Ib ribonucleoside-diphosphate reductase assembly flavoprotein NrdI n=1 Tax=Agrococcus jejuensis TaxID=399736 RepID=UPI00119D731A|nr:class Ib ribonucleoside-diphosphate reductase assembly flavoprotein NrdI [Agrococcus jejuensis]
MLLEAPVVAPEIVYFSSVSGNTARFVSKLGRPAARIPLHASAPALEVANPYVLVTPTYGEHGRGSVPKQVIRFLNDEGNRALLRGVVAGGNTNFGSDFCIAGDIIAAKCDVPYLHRFEVFGTPDDVTILNQRLDDLWQL